MQTLPHVPSRVDPVVDNYHGTDVSDPYRWLEDGESPETVAWVEAQNAATRSLLDRVPGRERIHRRLEELLSIGVVTAPAVRRGRYFYLRREGTQNQPVLYLRDRDGSERVLLDPNAESAEGTVALDWWYPSRDGSLLAYGYSANGNEWSTLHVLDVGSGTLLPDRIERTRYASLTWLLDNSGFFYTRYPTPGQVPEGQENYNQRPFFHRLGTDPSSDPELQVTELAPEDVVSLSLSRDGRYLLATVFHGWERSDVWIRDLRAEDQTFHPVALGHDALFSAEIAGGRLYLHTNLDAPRYRLFRLDPHRPEREAWQEIVPEAQDAVLESVGLIAGHLVGQYLRNASSALTLFDPEGGQQGQVELSVLGTVTAVTGEWEGDEIFYGFESFTLPPTVYRLEPGAGSSEVWAGVEAPVNTEDYTVRQEWYSSRDGTRVSLFLVHRKDLDLTAPQPAVLTGYGGFNISRTPLFSRATYLWLEHGGLFALPNLRGGAEYGEEWHRAGMLAQKQNVFDDFICAAEYLIERGYTDRSRLGIFGGSNGGLLVGAALTQRPDLVRAVVCSVPLLDMLRYQHFLIARLWIPEYGSADNPEQFPFLHAYSPYHQVRDGESYPSVLLETAESDSRVDPMHARKMAARLQAANASEHPILLRVETRAGHGAGKPLTKLIEEQTDFWSFLFWQLVQLQGR